MLPGTVGTLQDSFAPYGGQAQIIAMAIIGPKKFAPQYIATAATAQTYEKWDCANLCDLRFRS